MILEFLGDNLDGDAWETLINECYREKYKEHGPMSRFSTS